MKSVVGTNGDTATEVEFGLSGEDSFALTVSARMDCRLELCAIRRRSDGRSLVVVDVEGVEPGRVVRLGEAHDDVEACRTLRADDDGGRVQFVRSGRDVTTTLADAEAFARTVRLANGEGRVVAVVPPDVDARAVIETVVDRHDGASLVAYRTRVGRREGDRDGTGRLLDRLTDRQEESLRTAHDAGYFEWPRDATAEECARLLGVAQPTFSQHLRVGERKLLDGLLAGPATGVDQY